MAEDGGITPSEALEAASVATPDAGVDMEALAEQVALKLAAQQPQPTVNPAAEDAMRFLNAYRSDPTGFVSVLAERTGLTPAPPDPFQDVDLDLADPAVKALKAQNDRLAADIAAMRREQSQAAEQNRQAWEQQQAWEQSLQALRQQRPDVDVQRIEAARRATGLSDPETLYKIAYFSEAPPPAQMAAAEQASQLVHGTTSGAQPARTVDLDSMPHRQRMRTLISEAIAEAHGTA